MHANERTCIPLFSTTRQRCSRPLRAGETLRSGDGFRERPCRCRAVQRQSYRHKHNEDRSAHGPFNML